MANAKDPFFVGWGKIPKDFKVFLISLTVSFIAGFAVLSYAIAATQNDPGDAAFMGPTTAVGLLQADPYPVLHVINSGRHQPGDSIILSGGGKRGVVERAAALDGNIVRAAGVTLQRGDLNGMQLRGGRNGLQLDDTEAQTIEIVTEKLGKWRLTGEICDGKCLGGAMRPGTGLAHKACANLCLLGGVPPVFVSSAPVAGGEFLLMADADGKAVTSEVLDFTAAYVEIEGDIERRGDLLIFKISPETIRLAQ